MLQLIIDGHPAILRQDSQIKLTRENPYFTSAGDYTLDVVLPLAGCTENRRILGFLHRPEATLTPQAGRRLPFHLASEGITIDGHAVITSVTDQEAKLQLVGGISDLRNAIDDEEQTYINAMDLGRAWDELGELASAEIPSLKYTPSESTEEAASWMCLEHACTMADGTMLVTDDAIHGDYPGTTCLCYPIYSTAEDRVANRHGVVGKHFESGYKYKEWAPVISKGQEWKDMLIAPQPYLLHVISRIITAAGYTLALSPLVGKNAIYQTFIANARATTELRKMLPKWTLADFLKNVEDTFGLEFLCHGREVRLTTRSEYYEREAPSYAVTEATDETIADIEEEIDSQNSNSMAGNVDYEWPAGDDILHLPDEVFENARQLSFQYLTQIKDHFKHLSDEQKKRSEYLYTCTTDGRRYAILNSADAPDTYTLHRVDHLGPLLRSEDSREITTKLKIVPASFILQDTYGDNVEVNPVNDHTQFLPADDFATGFPILSTADTTAVLDHYSVNDSINPQEGDETTSADPADIITIAGHHKGFTAHWDDMLDNPTPRIPIAQPYVRHPDTNLPELPANFTTTAATSTEIYLLAQRRGTGWKGNICDAIAGGPKVDTRVVRQFTVTDRAATDPTAIYLIRGRRYVCQKIELTLDHRGILPEKKLYLYELN